MIVSEAQAERIGARVTGGERGHAFTVFRYVDRFSKLTLFGVEAGDRIITRDPSAAVSAHRDERTTNGRISNHS